MILLSPYSVTVTQELSWYQGFQDNYWYVSHISYKFIHFYPHRDLTCINFLNWKIIYFVPFIKFTWYFIAFNDFIKISRYLTNISSILYRNNTAGQISIIVLRVARVLVTTITGMTQIFHVKMSCKAIHVAKGIISFLFNLFYFSCYCLFTPIIIIFLRYIMSVFILIISIIVNTYISSKIIQINL